MSLDGAIEPLIVLKTAYCLLVMSIRSKKKKKNSHSFIVGVPRLRLPFPPKVMFLDMCLWQKPPRQSEA